MNLIEFKNLLRKFSCEEVNDILWQWNNPHILGSIEAYQQFKDTFSEYIQINNVDDIRIVGSSLLGFSLAPQKFGKSISETSDVDIAVISDIRFDEAWEELVRHNTKLNWSKSVGQKNILENKSRMNMSCLFWGFIRPDLLPGVHGKMWNDALMKLGKFPGLESYPAKARLYRKNLFAHIYHTYSLRILKSQLV
ncbi:MAG: hypothetical protein JXR49_18435 [Acidobacteria bacterium]|nr:hypothetical protein [Acidobacteriota bacterium]